MDTLQFITEIVKALTWPIVTIILVYTLKNSIVDIFKRLNKLEYKELKVELQSVREQVKELPKTMPPEPHARGSMEDQVLSTVETAPSASIMLAWSYLEASVSDAVKRLNLDKTGIMNNTPLRKIELLFTHPKMDRAYYNVFRQMREIRNKITHDSQAASRITQDDALNYVVPALDFANFIKGIQ